MDDLQQKDLRYIWHPCSQMKDYETFLPIVIERGEGPYLFDVEGKSYLDAVSSWWVNLFGHSNKRINRALTEQIERLEHVIFANFSHRPAIELAERIVEITPEGLNKVFFGDNGSSAVEIALKISFQYHQQMGRERKTRFLAISDAYHGETLGALSVGDIGLYNEIYKPLLAKTFKVEGPNCYRCKYGETRETCSTQCFTYMEKAIQQHHEVLSGIIIEPMIQGAAGMKIYSPVYLQKLRELCSVYDIHLIADEIAVGFGRTGKMFACEHPEISPDIMCLSKGLTAGYMPMALVLMTDEIYNGFYDDYTNLRAFMHSHSYTGNPIGCAVACESLNIFRDEDVLEKNKITSQKIKDRVEGLLAHPHVGEFRQLGMVGALELVKDKKTKEGFAWEKRVGYEIYQIALKYGVLLRPLGNVIYFMPPYVINDRDIDLMIGTAERAIQEYFGK
ncbi:MAG: adenosylmethionine--8-amino-7-oxononanoate transaminase [Bacillota bacterium]